MKFLGLTLLGQCAYVWAQMAGGWNPGSISDSDTINAYGKAMSLQSNFDGTSWPILCTAKINSVEQQVVSGMNYKFHVAGCVVGSLQAATRNVCTCLSTTKYVVVIYDQSWTNTHKVLNITLDNE
ncbi:hypothetical protein THRCLA_00382 [Thraustotheca clavata]|uniref:Secreted protein n=1 Tax=Thraustotheca clavata TaxID=74557 RepID=A0A1W0ABG2_9STRA|nr:hypothetical protein THRCLA_00382 [Thraustotheca clavata]